jgi:Fic family protein/DNA-binding XRE family transcriptional regulator
MSIIQALKKIRATSGMTQEALARELGVSFVTLNSWERGRSTPRKKMQERIHASHAHYVTGNQNVSHTALAEKKEQIATLQHAHANIARLLSRNDIREQYLLSLTHNTNRIEGSTLSEAETAAVLFDDATIPQKTLTEHLEAKHHQHVLETLFARARDNTLPNITQTYILSLHHTLMNGILDSAGSYRTHSVRIVGAHVPTTNWQKIPERMHALTIEMRHLEKKDPIAHLARTHALFEQIHPFADGNGRIGRILMHHMALRYNLPPLLISHSRKRAYYACLQTAQLKDIHEPLQDFLCDAIIESYAMCDNAT